MRPNRQVAQGILRKSTPAQRWLSDREGAIPGLEDDGLHSERAIVGAALALGAKKVEGWSSEEERLSHQVERPSRTIVSRLWERISAGEDPLGDAFCRLRSPEERRGRGAVFTPHPIVEAMIGCVTPVGEPARIVDPGTGSGRFLSAAGRRFANATLVGVEVDPLPAIVARANLAAAGLANRSRIILEDFRALALPPVSGRTLYIGNPPYVRHHLLDARWKAWLTEVAKRRGHTASQLAGLHVHFFLATVEKATLGDFGAFITAAEWMDVNYGSLVRELFLAGLGGKRIVVIEPTAAPFPDAASTAAITYFQIGAKPKRIKLRRVENMRDLRDLNGNRELCRERLETEKRWSHLTRGIKPGPQGFIELGELCRVHRGQVTGANRVWIAGAHSHGLPTSLLFPTVTKARELFQAGNALRDDSSLRNVIDLPVELDILGRKDRAAVDRFLITAKSLGADTGYIATARKAWWSVGLRFPAPILTTYMARRPPAFVHNAAQVRHLNIAHGIYPRESYGKSVINNLVAYLQSNVQLVHGRTYAGGLTKFEPREVERLMVPSPEMLEKGFFE